MKASQNPQVLVVSSDRSLRDEFDQAVRGLRRFDPVVRHAEDLRVGGEVARSRRPGLVIVEMGSDAGELVRFAREVSTEAPECEIVATYRADAFGPEAPVSDAIIAGVRAGVRDFLRRPLSTEDLQRILDRLPDSEEGVASGRSAGRVVCLTSNKGGVGKTTIAVNLACRLARSAPDRVLLVDASLQLGICAQLLDLDPSVTLLDAVREIDRIDETLLREIALRHDCGLHVLPAPPDAVAASEVGEEGLARVLAVARRSYDFVVVDTFPVLDGAVIAILDLCDLACVVFQSTIPCVLGIERYLRVLDDVGLPRGRQRLLLSRSHARFRGELAASDIERRIGRAIDLRVPYSRAALESMNTGRPVALRRAFASPFVRAIRRLERSVRLLAERRARPARRGVGEARSGEETAREDGPAGTEADRSAHVPGAAGEEISSP